jgi:hypothetical protein
VVGDIIEFPMIICDIADLEPAVDIEAINYRLSDLLGRWVILDEELKRRLGPMPVAPWNCQT